MRSKLIASFLAWLGQAKMGEGFPYHSGLLARDREKSKEVEAMAQSAALAAEGGFVLLFQHRLRPGPLNAEPGCLYIARRTNRPLPEGEPEGENQ